LQNYGCGFWLCWNLELAGSCFFKPRTAFATQELISVNLDWQNPVFAKPGIVVFESRMQFVKPGIGFGEPGMRFMKPGMCFQTPKAVSAKSGLWVLNLEPIL